MARVHTTMAVRLKRLRTQRGLSQQALADRVGVSQPFIAQIEGRQYTPSVAVLMRLAKALRVPVEDLLP